MPRASETLLREIQTLKVNAFGYMRMLATATPEQLVVFGYRGQTNAEAVLSRLNTTAARIEDLTREFEAKHPEE